MTTDSEPAVMSASNEGRAHPAWWVILRRQSAAFLTAVRFLTRVPLPDWLFPAREEPDVLLCASVVYFPLVGSLIGAATAGVIAGAAEVLSLWLAVLIGLAFEALLTGAFHEDAVADFCDAFGGGWTRADVLRILKDSRVGSFGVLGLTLAVLLRAGATADVAPSLQFAAVIASATLGRWLMLFVMAWLPPVPDRASVSRAIAQQVGLRDLALATFLAAPGVVLMGLAMPIGLLGAFLSLVVTGLLFSRYVRRRIGGVTGDCLGFVCYLGQVMVLLVAAARIHG